MLIKKVYKVFVAVLIFLMSAATGHARIYVVCVGINDYPGNAQLNNCVSDADSIKFIYDHQRDTRTIVLRDGQATKANIKSQMRTLFAEAGTDDLVVFFFSGHGYPGGFVAIDGQLPYSDIRQSIATTRARHKMIFADACYAGRMRNRRSHARQQSQIKNADVMLFLASRSNETSLESRTMSNGHFTAALKRGLRGGADENRDRIITAKELFTYVSKKVHNSTHDKQHPVMWGRFDDDMPVLKW